jgi:hypothetical protein
VIGGKRSIPVGELRAVVSHVRELEATSRRASCLSIWTYALLFVILLESIRVGASSAYLPPSLQTIEESRMRALQNLGVVSSIAIASVATAQNAVEWRVADGGNGHWYELVVPSERISMTAAATAAQALGGALCSVGSAAENQFVFELASADPSRWTIAWPGAGQITGPWLGASYVAGSWTWLDGTSWSYTQWAPTEPNYLFEETAVLFMGPAGGSPTPQWNNLRPDYVNWGYVVEWSADCNNDGIVDFGQTLSGELPDYDSNRVPDCCEQSAICSPTPSEWSASAGGNGHWYQLVLPPVRVSATEASVFARARGGELASISSAAENSHVFSIASVYPNLWTLAWSGATQITGPWLGARYQASSWTWLDGSTWVYANWAPGEPNFLFEETAVHFMGSAAGRPTNKWNNNRPDYLNWGYMVEWSADCNGDGIVDFGQIRSGQLPDSNHDGIPDCCAAGMSCSPCVADVDGTGVVDGADLTVILNGWGSSGGAASSGDVNGDGLVDGADLSEVLNAWGPCP